MNKNLKRIIALALVIGAFSAATPATNFNLLTTKAYATSSSADELTSIDLQDKDGDSLDICTDSSYNDKLDGDLNEGDTYYAESSTSKVTIDNVSGADDDKVRIFKGSSDTAYEVGDNISLSDGTTTLKVRVYENDYDDSEDYSSSDYNQYTIKVEYNSDSSDAENDVDTLDSLELLNSDGNNIKLYSDNDYASDNKVDSSEVEEGETYYAKTSSGSISVDIDGPDEKYVKVFKATSNSTKGVDPGDDISVSADKTLTVRIYSSEPDSDVTYEDDGDVIGEYKIKLEYTGDSSDSSSSNTTASSSSTTTTDSTSTSSTTTATLTPGTTTAVSPISPNSTAVSPTSTVKPNQWVQVNGGWQYNDNLGNPLKSQWFWDKNYVKWYYLGADGMMATNSWILTGGKYYYLGSNGAMATNTMIGIYKVGNDGAWIH